MLTMSADEHRDGVANRGIIAGIDRADLFNMIRAYTPDGGRVVPDSEIQAAVEKAARECTQTNWRPKPQQRAPRFNAAAFMAARLHETGGVVVEMMVGSLFHTGTRLKDRLLGAKVSSPKATHPEPTTGM